MRIDGTQALARIRADLGRDPVDRLEAAVVLERSGGLTGEKAIAMGAEAFDRCPPPREPESETRRPLPPESTAVDSILLVLVSLIWASTLGGPGALVDPTSTLVALPIGLGVAGYLDRRYLGGEHGPARARTYRVPIGLVVLGGAASVAVIAPGPVAPGVVVVLVVTAAAARFRAALPVGAVLLVGFVAAEVGAPPTAAAVASLVGAIGLLAVWTRSNALVSAAPAPLRLGLMRGTSSAGVGLLTMPVVAWTIDVASVAPILLVLPSMLGGAAAAARLDRVWTELPDALRSAPAGLEIDLHLRTRYGRLVAGGAALGAAVTVLTSIGVVAVRGGAETGGVLAAMAAIAAQSYAIAVLHGVGTEGEVAGASVASGLMALLVVAVGGAALVAVWLAVVAAHCLWVPLIWQVARDPEQVVVGQM